MIKDILVYPNPILRKRLDQHHKILLSNFFAQPQALMDGRSLEEVKRELRNEGLDEKMVDKIAPHKVFEGNRPTTTILCSELNPYTLGMLIAMYEHKVFTQGVIWNIYSFDQFGVELGKQLARKILPQLKQRGGTNKDYDSSTKGLIEAYKDMSSSSLRGCVGFCFV
jgi:glucose-6-phosphate isomerase